MRPIRPLVPSRLSAFLLILVLASAGPAAAAPGDLDPTFGEGGRVRFGFGGGSDVARRLVLQPDGKILVAAQAVNGAHTEIALARYHPDGAIDTEFGDQGRVWTAIMPSLNATQKGDDFVTAIALQEDKILVAGLGRAVGWGNGNDFVLARYDLDGNLDPTFDGDGRVITDFFGGSDECNGMAVQSDGKIVLAGIVTVGGDSDFGIVRYNPDGSLDPTFGGGDGKVNHSIGPGDQARAVAIQDDGKILVTGFAFVPPSTEAVAILRLLTDGSPDPSFDFDGKLTRNVSANSGYEAGHTVAIQRHLTLPHKIVVAGLAPGAISGNQTFVLRVNLEGTPDNLFDGDGLVLVPGPTFVGGTAIAFESSGGNPSKLVIGTDNGTAPVVARFNLDGTPDLTWNGDGLAVAPILASGGGGVLLPGGTKVIVGGGVSVGGQNDAAIARLDAGGNPDPTFDNDGIRSDDLGNAPATATAVVHQPNGKILVAGTVRLGGIDRIALARLDGFGRPDPGFDGDGRVVTTIGDVSTRGNALVLQPDGKVVVAGTAQVNGPPVFSHFAAARYAANGALDPTFAGSGTTTVAVYGFADGRAAARQDDGKIVIAGSTQFGGDANFALVRLDTLGVPDPAFDGDGRISTQLGSFADTARAVLVRPDGVILAVGSSLVSGTPEFAAASYGGNGNLDVTFSGDGKAYTSVDFWADHAYACAIQASAGRVVLAGQSFGMKTEGNFGLLRYDIFGNPDPTFGAGGTFVHPVSTGPSGGRGMAVLPDGRFLVGGWARPAGAASDFAVIRFLEGGENDATYGPGGQAVVDVRLGSEDRGNALSVDPYERAVVAGESGGLFGLIRLLGDGGLVGVDEPAPGASAAGVRLSLLGAHPAPGPTRLAFDLPHAADVALEVFDVRGARVRTVARGSYPAGRHRLEWDGRDGAGGAVAPGVYFARLVAAGEARSARVVRLGW